MHCAVAADQFRAGLKQIMGVVGTAKDERMLILRNVLLDAGTATLTVRGADTHLTAALPVNANVISPGLLTVDARFLYKVVQKCAGDGPITLESILDGKQLRVQHNGTTYQLNALPAERFPTWPPMESPVRFTLPSKAVRTLLAQTRFAASGDEQRAHMRGVRLVPAGDKELLAVATNGTLMAIARATIDEPVAGLEPITLPLDVVDYMLRLSDPENDESAIHCALSKTQVEFRTADYHLQLTSQLAHQDFPDYTRVAPPPDRNTIVVQLERANIVPALERIGAILRGGISARTRLTIHDTSLLLETKAKSELDQEGSAREEVDAFCAKPGLTVHLNCKHLLDIVSNLEGERFTMRFEDPGTPIMVLSGDNLSGAYYLMMPMR